MPKKKEADDQKAQSERFKKAAQELIDAGELNPIEADEAIGKILIKERPQKPSPTDDA